MGRVLAKTIAVYDEATGSSVTYLEGKEVPDEVAAKITNPKVWAEEVEDTSEADDAAYERTREAFDAGRPLRILSDEERLAWAYSPDSEGGVAAEAKLAKAEGGADPDNAAGLSDPAGDDFPSYTDKPRPDGWEKFTDDEKRDYIYAPVEGADGGAGPDDDDVIDFSDEPPREGKGSGVTAWRTYAEAKGLEVSADADVDSIRAIVDARKASQAAE